MLAFAPTASSQQNANGDKQAQSKSAKPQAKDKDEPPVAPEGTQVATEETKDCKQ
jgi:hypothetical protein